MSNLPSARFPSFDGRSGSRTELYQYKEPDGADFDQLVAEIKRHQDYLSNSVHSFSMVPAAGGANICNVVISALDANGDVIAAVHQFDLWLSDSAVGEGHTATAASGTVTNKSASGLVVATQVAKKALTVQTLSTGLFTLEITDTGKTAFNICARAPGSGKTVIGATLVTDNYG